VIYSARDKLSPEYDRFIEKHWRIYQSALLDKISNAVNAVDTVLEVACGTGLVALKVAKRAFWVSGIDISAPMIDEAEKKIEGKSLGNVEFSSQLPWFSIVNKEILKNPQDMMPLSYVLAESKA
jgi:ubiquinone/menaquinone biosynthesis C-methylase UbiE